MNKNVSLGLVGAGGVVLLLGLIAHFQFHNQVFPHFSIVVGLVAVVLLALGGWGYTQKA